MNWNDYCRQRHASSGIIRAVVALILIVASVYHGATAQAAGIGAGTVVVPGPPWPDSIGVPIQIEMDDTIKAFSIWLRPELVSEQFIDLRPSSFVPNTDLFQQLPNGYWGPDTYEDPENALGCHWTSVLPAGIVGSPSDVIGILYLRIAGAEIPFGTVVALDTINIPSLAPTVIEVITGGVAHLIEAPFVWTPENIIFGAPIACGDVDASGDVSITDAVFILNYIFAGGPPPFHTGTGDVDCDGMLIITDAVYLVNYIFGGGALPCSECLLRQ